MGEKSKEEKDMHTLQERLDIANKKVDLRIDDIWGKAEDNLKKLKEEFYRQKEGDSK